MKSRFITGIACLALAVTGVSAGVSTTDAEAARKSCAATNKAIQSAARLQVRADNLVDQLSRMILNSTTLPSGSVEVKSKIGHVTIVTTYTRAGFQRATTTLSNRAGSLMRQSQAIYNDVADSDC